MIAGGVGGDRESSAGTGGSSRGSAGTGGTSRGSAGTGGTSRGSAGTGGTSRGSAGSDSGASAGSSDASGGADPGAASAPVDEPPVPSPEPSTPIVLAPLPSPDLSRPLQHATQVSIAAHDGHVVVAALHLHTDTATTLDAASVLRRVGVAISHDSGATFTATTDPGVAPNVTEVSFPVVRATKEGAFWLSAIGYDANGRSSGATLLWSTSKGRSWDAVPGEFSALVGKEWLAPTPEGGMVLGGRGGFWRFDRGGEVMASWLTGQPGRPVMGAYVDDRGAHFATELDVALWSGSDSLVSEGAVLISASWFPGWSVPIGPTKEGGTWAVYDRRNLNAKDQSIVELRILGPDDRIGEVVPISAPGTAAFMPAAALDADGRVHVIWYESTGPEGVLKYASSVDADLRKGFSPARIVDANACPGAGWLPSYGNDTSDRRLQDYIDIAIDGRRAHAAWTHAPSLPSRVYTSHWDF